MTKEIKKRAVLGQKFEAPESQSKYFVRGIMIFVFSVIMLFIMIRKIFAITE